MMTRISLAITTLPSLVIVTGLLSAGALVAAQENGGKPAAAARSGATATTDILETDPRLKIKVTIQRRDVTISESLRDLAAMTKINFVVQLLRVGQSRLSFSFADTPLKDVLDGIASLFGYEWERRPSGVYLLRLRQTAAARHEKTKAEKQIDDSEQALLDQYNNLSPDQKAALADDYKLSATDLPPSMQDSLRGVLSGTIDRYGEQVNAPVGDPQALAMQQSTQGMLDNFGSLRIQMYMKTDQGGPIYTLGISLPQVAFRGVSFRPRR